MSRIEITEITDETNDFPPTHRVVLKQEMESLDLPAILKAVNGLGRRKRRKGAKAE